MAHYLTNNEKFHIFSKSPVLSSMAVSQAVNKSGHTVSTNDVWADDVPWFTEVADEAGAITRAADARYNDLILWGSDIYVRKGDKTNGASTGTTFAELWEKHTELTEARAYALGSVTTQTPTNIVTKTVEIKNASDKVVLKYHVGKQIDLLTTANNANVASTWAARMFIDGKVVDQFVSPTDKVFAGNPSTGYTTLVYTATAAGNKYGFVAEGEADADFVNNAFAGIVQFNQSRDSGHKFAASVFEYVGDKLDATVAKLSAAVFGSGTPDTPDAPSSLSEQVTANTTAINVLKGADTVEGSIAHSIKTAIKNLGDVAVKSDIKISEIKVKSGSTTTTLTPDSNKSVTVEIPEVQAATTSVAGVVTISDNDAIATTETSTAAATVAAVAATRSAIAGELGALAETVGSNKTEVDGKITAIEGKLASTGEIGQAIADVKATADSAVQSVTRASGSSTLLTVTDGTNATISLSTEVATKTDAATAASTAITSSLADTTTDGTIGNAIATAKIGAEQTAATALSTARGEITTEIGTAVSGLKTELTTGEGSLGAKVAALETATGTTLPAAIEQALTDAKAYSDSLHTTSLDYVVLGDSETLPTASASTLGKIYLVASQNAPTADGAAISGSYVEYMTRKVGEGETATYTWEKIGTTAADLSGYAKSVTINGQTYNVSANTVSLGEHFVNSVAPANSTALGNAGSLYAHIATNGTLTLGIASATDSVMGVSKMFTGNLSTTSSSTDATDTAVSVYSAQAMYGSLATLANSKVASVTDGYYLNLAGLAVETSGTDVTIKPTSISQFDTSIIGVNGNIARGQNGARVNIDTDKIFANNATETPITMIKAKTNLQYWIADIPNVVNGSSMFEGCTQLATFCGDLSSVTNGYHMFYMDTALTSFCGDLSGLTGAGGMFSDCKLDAESLECIADTINDVRSLTTSTEVTKLINIGYNCSADAAQAAQTAIQAKGWTCTMTYKG